MAVYTPIDYIIGITILLVIMWLASKLVFPKIDLDMHFAFAMAPVIVFTIAVRVLADAGVFEKNDYWSVTPGIYILGTMYAIMVLIVGKALERRNITFYWKGSVLAGTPLALYYSYRLYAEMTNPPLIFEPHLLALILTAAIYIVSGQGDSTRFFREKTNISIIYGHMLDGSATFIGIDKYGFSEEHILPELLINTAGTAFVMIPLKIVLVLGALYLLEKWSEEEEGSDLYYRMVKFVFFIFGFGPGMRDSLLLGL